jgi:hypothetical protein
MATWNAGQSWSRESDPRRLRTRLLARLEARLRRDSPRVLMAVIVAGTAAAGLLASAVLLYVGVHRMWFRYGLSVAIAYAAFVSFVWLWLQKKRRVRFDDPGWDGGWPKGDANPSDANPSEANPSDGADAIRAIDPPAAGGSGAGHPGGLLDLDDSVVWFAVIAAIASAVVAGAYVVFVAPELLAEVLLDGVLAGALYRRLRRLDSRHWLESAIARTWLPIVVVAVFFMIAGAVCHWYAPEASTLSGVWRHYGAKR